jgi:hypothetical protein
VSVIDRDVTQKLDQAVKLLLQRVKGTIRGRGGRTVQADDFTHIECFEMGIVEDGRLLTGMEERCSRRG